MTALDVAADDEEVDVAKSLGEALANHASCAYIQVDLPKLLSSTSHDGMELRLVMQSFAPLLHYIRTSKSSRHVSLSTASITTTSPHNDPLTETLLTQVASAIAENAHIDTLECLVQGSYIALPTNALAVATTTSTSGAHIRKFILVLLEEHLCTDQQKTMLANSLCNNNETLVNLTLVSVGGGDVAAAILRQLQGRCPNLGYLTLSVKQPPSMEHIQALEQFIQTDTATTATLQFVYLCGYHFHSTGSGSLFAALLDSATELALSKCKLDEEATDMFVQAMQQVKNDVKPTRLLHVHAGLEFANKSLGTVLATALAGSWRSGLLVEQSLHNTGGDDSAAPLADLFHGMVANYRNIRLSCLLLDTLCARGAEALALFLPLSSTLSTLRIDTLEDGVNQRQLFHAIRRNGSLFDVKIEALSSSLVYGPRLASILQRNLALPLLVTSKGMLPFFPAAFCAAQEAPRMAPNNVLMGLAAADDETIGPSQRQGRGVKRHREE